MTSVQFVPPLVDPAHPDMAAIRAKVTRTLHPAAAATPASAAPATTPASTKPATPAGPTPSPSSSGVAEGLVPSSADVQAVCSAG